MARRYLQGKFTPKNPHKYAGDPSNIVFRSSWELKAFKMLDEEPGVLKWASEEFNIPYIGLDGKPHRYFIDLIMITKGGKYIIEIKPSSQTKKPNKGKGRKKESTFINECITYETNQRKWKAAEKWAAENGMSFLIWTEKDLNI